MKAPGTGIVGIGVFLPPVVRKNDFWQSHLAAFGQRRGEDLGNPADRPAAADPIDPELLQIVGEEMAKWKTAEFHGIVERRVAPDGMTSSDMEYLAAKAALDDAGIRPDQVGMLLLESFLPDRAVSTNPVTVHRRLGLPTTCPAIETDRTCAAFLFQMQLGCAYLRATDAPYILAVQSTLYSRILDLDSPVSTTFGDAATAVVLGRVSPSRGLLSLQSFTDDRFEGIAVLEPREEGKPWYCGAGQLIHKTADRERLPMVPAYSAKIARDSVSRVLAEAGLKPSDVGFFTGHQPTASFSTICRRAAGLDHVKSVDTYRNLGAISACVIPVNLRLAREEGLLKTDDAAVVFSTGAGISWAAAAIRWGG